MKKTYKILFLNMIFISTLISISSISWFMAWMGLEMNLMMMMPILKNFKNIYSSESAIKYFIVQAMGSSLFLFSILIYFNMKYFNFMELYYISSMMVDSSLLLKIGAAPFHFWFPEVLSGMNWMMNFFMSTWQKIAPFLLLMNSSKTPIFLFFITILSSMLSGIQGLNQVCLRKFMAFSSINHIGWMISSIFNSFNIWFYYFMIYCLINLNIIIIFYKMNILFINQISNLFTNKNLKFMFMMNFLSLGGLPPFLGFLPKWMTIIFLIKFNFFIIAIFLIIFTLLTLYFYMRLTFSTFSMYSMEKFNYLILKSSFWIYKINFLMLSSLLLCSLLTNIF